LLKQFVDHYLTERYHQGLGNQIIMPTPSPSNDNPTPGAIGCRSRLGGLLNYYRMRPLEARPRLFGHHGVCSPTPWLGFLPGNRAKTEYFGTTAGRKGVQSQ
jgi:hypothetical protein